MMYTCLLILESHAKSDVETVSNLTKDNQLFSLNKEPFKVQVVLEQDGSMDFATDDWVAKWDITEVFKFLKKAVKSGHVDVFLKDTYLGDFAYRVIPGEVHRMYMRFEPIFKCLNIKLRRKVK